MRGESRTGSPSLQRKLSSLRLSLGTKSFWKLYRKLATMKISATEDVMEPCRMPMAMVVEISRGNMWMRTATKEKRTLLEVAQETASEMTAPGSRRIKMATTAILVLPDKVLAAIDTARVDTSTKCRGSMRDETFQAAVAVATRTEVVEVVETQDVVTIRITAVVAMEEVARERMIVAVAAEEAKVEVEATGMVRPDTRV
jgi:hypothetical protein